MEQNLICNICQSTCLRDLGGTTSLAYYRPFVDSYGANHHHDGNYVCRAYECENKHVFSVQIPNKCHCGWVQEKR